MNPEYSLPSCLKLYCNFFWGTPAQLVLAHLRFFTDWRVPIKGKENASGCCGWKWVVIPLSLPPLTDMALSSLTDSLGFFCTKYLLPFLVLLDNLLFYHICGPQPSFLIKLRVMTPHGVASLNVGIKGCLAKVEVFCVCHKPKWMKCQRSDEPDVFLAPSAMLDHMTSLKPGFCAYRVFTLHCIYGHFTKGQGMLPGMAQFIFEGTVCYELQCPFIQSFQLLQ